nr:hypothetical protein [uncultured Desulfobulbus sp.]
MDKLNKHALLYTYTWHHYPENDPKVSGPPDTTLFNKHEGEEVLYLIDYLSEHIAWSVEEFASKVERLIHDHMPEHEMSQVEVVAWIKENWKLPLAAAA